MRAHAQQFLMFVCFILGLRPQSRRGMWTIDDKRNRLPRLRASHNKSDPPFPACAVRISQGMGPPLQWKETKSKETKRSRWWLWWQLQARVPPCLLLLRLPHYPFIHSSRVSLVLIYSNFRIPSNTGQLQKSQQPALPPWVREECPNSTWIPSLPRSATELDILEIFLRSLPAQR
jgi:hypothetical protein